MVFCDLTFDVEIHWLADICSNIVTDAAQVETAVLLQHVLDEQRAIDQNLDSKPWVEGDGFELWHSSAWKSKQLSVILILKVKTQGNRQHWNMLVVRVCFSAA